MSCWTNDETAHRQFRSQCRRNHRLNHTLLHCRLGRRLDRHLNHRLNQPLGGRHLPPVRSCDHRPRSRPRPRPRPAEGPATSLMDEKSRKYAESRIEIITYQYTQFSILISWVGTVLGDLPRRLQSSRFLQRAHGHNRF
jgi:hypothetical protein